MCRSIIKYVIGLLCCIYSSNYFSQSSLVLEGNFGKIVHHKRGLLYKIPKLTDGVILHFIDESVRESAQARFWGNPHYVYSIAYTNFGDENVLGSAYSALMGISFNIFRTDFFQAKFNLSAGIAYLNKKYHIDLNPTNNAIGSHINSTTRFSINNTFRLSNKLQLKVGGSMVHFSNARTRSPNSGINAFIGDVGLGYRFISRKSKQTTKVDGVSVSKREKLFAADIFYTYGITNSGIPGGPQYHLDIFGAGFSYAITPYINILSGYEYDINYLLFHFYLRNFRSRQEARQLAERQIIYIGSELIFTKIAFRNQIGFYLPIFAHENSDKLYFKLMLMYYPFGHQLKVSPYLGVSMKSHFGVAEHVGLTLGTKIFLF